MGGCLPHLPHLREGEETSWKLPTNRPFAFGRKELLQYQEGRLGRLVVFSGARSSISSISNSAAEHLAISTCTGVPAGSGGAGLATTTTTVILSHHHLGGRAGTGVPTCWP